MASNSELLRFAITNKKQIRAYYDGFHREMCPHAMGWKNEVHHVLSFQFAGQSSRPLPPEGQWKCMDVDGLTALAVVDGPWITGSNHSKPQTCIDQIEVEVAY
ncbi:MAG TPA: hypothetical protein VG206_26785 [Terriglobia bacterium]|nr:hypothetical protein [Terriglobia bacterium]